MKTELLIAVITAKSFEVVERPEGEGPIEKKDIKVLYRCRRKDLAVAFAEGRQSVSGQTIRMN